MSTYLTIEGDPDRTATAGLRMRTIAESLRRALQAPLAEIDAIDAAREVAALGHATMRAMAEVQAADARNAADLRSATDR